MDQEGTPKETTFIDANEQPTKNKAKIKSKPKNKLTNKKRENLTPNVAGNYRGRKAAEDLLTEKEKKLHHIASEQKRRKNIKLGYDRLTTLVPNLAAKKQHVNPSETCVLQESVEYLKMLINKQNELKEEIAELDNKIEGNQ